MSERNLYEVTGDIKDINTMLVPRAQAAPRVVNVSTKGCKPEDLLDFNTLVPLLSDAEIDQITDHQWDAHAQYLHAAYRAYARAIEQAVLAKRVPMQQISDGEFAPDAKLLELADKIDHEQNGRHSGIFQRDHLTQDQKDRVLAGVMLRRYADLMAPESWRLFPPKSVVSHSYRAATLDAVVKMAERHGIVGKEGA